MVDYSFIIRCILGIPYTDINDSKYLLQNTMISLINSPTLDMDKLDYIMRDAFYTGIAVPSIDTKRNIYPVNPYPSQYEEINASPASFDAPYKDV